ncbi:MAG: hypothetical protein ACODAD_03220 [Planctomycetota bacterium]
MHTLLPRGPNHRSNRPAAQRAVSRDFMSREFVSRDLVAALLRLVRGITVRAEFICGILAI